MIQTEIGYTTIDRITVRGQDLSNELLGKLDFVEMMMLTILGRVPDAREKRMVNLILVTACDHGLTPSAMAARLTYLGAPEAMQAAIAAGLLGAGSVFLGTTQNAAELLIGAARDLADDATDQAVMSCARQVVQSSKEHKRPIYGVGHPIHVNGDPRVAALAEISRENDCFGKHWRLAYAIERVLKDEQGKDLPLNAVAAIGAIVADMGWEPLLARGFMLVGRAAGLLAHLFEERQQPVGQQIWDLVLSQDPRNEIPQRKLREA
ncbi:citryl-CoA lyase [Alicycliphilus denitrificans]|uniref:citrate synthase (unknown stereospecificity) n=1 Tax=Alicycliphilus denitrificans TaxID=179636 RepID=A0A3R7EGJ0_9BURK|nr:citryl-CoA lyase [Alicycliphilus denitrificans]RKJ99235.1 citryl-CoA lyase [Alicycliphilus denitrificans]